MRINKDIIGGALEQAGAAVLSADGRQGVPFALKNGCLIRGEMALSDSWISVSAAAQDTGCDTPDWKQMWDRLQENGSLQYPVRFAVGRDGEEILRADIPIEDTDDESLGYDVAAVCEALKAAYAVGHGDRKNSPDVPGPSREGERVGLSDNGNPTKAFEKGPWGLTVKGEHIYADLDVTGRFLQARIEAQAGGHYRADAQILSAHEEWPSTCRHALGHFLLNISRLSRGVRPVVRGDGDRTRIACVVDFCVRRGPSRDLSRALSALSVVADLSLREVRALTNEDVSAAYVDAWAAGQSNIRSRSTEEEQRWVIQ